VEVARRLHPPKKDEAEFASENKLYIDPETCIDCGACVPSAGPAIFPLEELPRSGKLRQGRCGLYANKK